MTKEEKKEEFQVWLFEMDDRLEAFLEHVAMEGIKLDYSLDSLDAFGKFLLLEHYTPNHDYFITAARYYGEVVRKTYGGKWILDIEDENSLYYGLPVIKNYSPFEGMLFYPIDILGNFCRKKNKGLLKRAILADIEPSNFNWNT